MAGATEINEPLRKLSEELSKRFPDGFVQRFVMPTRVRECREVFIREIDGKDEIRAGAMADATMSKEERGSNKLANEAEKRESIRLSIVAIGERKGGWRAPESAPIVYRHVNDNAAIPFVEINSWKVTAWAALHTYFGTVNGVPMSELASGIEGAQIVGALAPPEVTSETTSVTTPVIPLSASTGT